MGNPDGLNDDQIHRAAWEIVEPHFTQDRQTSLAALRRSVRTPTRRLDKLEQILPAAVHGRVRTLYLRTDVPVWGRFDPATLSVEIHDAPRDGDTDLLCLATIHVLQSKGMVYALRKEEMPTKTPQAAMFRY